MSPRGRGCPAGCRRTCGRCSAPPLVGRFAGRSRRVIFFGAVTSAGVSAAGLAACRSLARGCSAARGGTVGRCTATGCCTGVSGAGVVRPLWRGRSGCAGFCAAGACGAAAGCGASSRIEIAGAGFGGTNSWGDAVASRLGFNSDSGGLAAGAAGTTSTPTARAGSPPVALTALPRSTAGPSATHRRWRPAAARRRTAARPPRRSRSKLRGRSGRLRLRRGHGNTLAHLLRKCRPPLPRCSNTAAVAGLCPFGQKAPSGNHNYD